MWIIPNCRKLLKRWEYQILLPVSWETCNAGQEATVRTVGTTDWFKTEKGAQQGYLLSPCSFNLYTEDIMRNAGLDELQAGIKIGGGVLWTWSPLLPFVRTSSQPTRPAPFFPPLHPPPPLLLLFCSTEGMLFSYLLIINTQEVGLPMQAWSIGREDPLEEGMATHSRFLAWRVPMDRGAWTRYIPWGRTESDTTEVT